MCERAAGGMVMVSCVYIYVCVGGGSWLTCQSKKFFFTCKRFLCRVKVLDMYLRSHAGKVCECMPKGIFVLASLL